MADLGIGHRSASGGKEIELAGQNAEANPNAWV